MDEMGAEKPYSSACPRFKDESLLRSMSGNEPWCGLGL
jgi:hypothetical protein